MDRQISGGGRMIERYTRKHYDHEVDIHGVARNMQRQAVISLDFPGSNVSGCNNRRTRGSHNCSSHFIQYPNFKYPGQTKSISGATLQPIRLRCIRMYCIGPLSFSGQNFVYPAKKTISFSRRQTY